MKNPVINEAGVPKTTFAQKKSTDDSNIRFIYHHTKDEAYKTGNMDN